MNLLLFILGIAALATTQALAGGRHLALYLPGLGLLVVAALLSWWPARRRPIPREAGETLVAALVFVGYITIRALCSPEGYLARNDFYVALGALVLYLLVALNLTSSRWRSWFVAALLVLAVTNCAIGAVQFFKGQEFMPFPFLPRPGYGTRASGFYGYPNHLSGFLEMALMLGLSFAFWSRWPSWSKILVGYICVMVLLGIIITGSRGGYIAGTVGLLVFALLSLVLAGKLVSGRLVGLLVAGLIVIGGAGWGVKQVMSKNAYLQARAGETLTVDISRMRLWQAAWKQFRLSPIVGTGSGTYLYYGRQFRNPAIYTDPVHAHNDYFELLAEYGILGIITAVIFLETHLRRGWNSVTQRLEDGADVHTFGSNSLALTVGALSAAAACLTHCLLDFNLHMPANVLTAAFVFGLLATPGEGPKDTILQEGATAWPPFLRFVLPALGILIAVKVAPSLSAEYYTERTDYLLSNSSRSVTPEVDYKMIDLARRGLVSDPRSPKLHFAMGQAQSTLGDLATDEKEKETFYHQAVESYRKALEFAPGDVDLVLALGSALDSLHLFAESDPLFARALTLDPRGGRVHNVVAFHYLQEDKLDEAEAEFKLALQLGTVQSAQAGLDMVKERRKLKGGDVPASLNEK